MVALQVIDFYHVHTTSILRFFSDLTDLSLSKTDIN
ncbi:MAG: hypothetical protein CG439_951 [Methylococcaceae bacterium NSP1-2]|nr:MAG: hypothetical protein CG439_951 [Methylococcaceae bacterium NSP1-2]